MFFRRILCVSSIALLAVPAAAQTDAGLAANLGDLLSAERAGLSAASERQLVALTGTPPASDAAIPAIAYEPAFIATQPEPGGGTQWECLSQALYHEARGEGVRGLFAVAEVILNRVDSGAYPDNVCAVINQGTGARDACQFSYTCDGLPEVVNEPDSWRVVGIVARLMLDGAPRELTAGATNYHARTVRPGWAARMARTAVIGSHLFYRGS